MSRSRKKYSRWQSISGNDRPFKVEGRRTLRAANKRVLKSLMAHKEINDVSDEVYDVRWVGAMDPWAWPSDGSTHSYYGTEEQYLHECEARWEQDRLLRARYKKKDVYMNKMKTIYRKGLNK